MGGDHGPTVTIPAALEFLERHLDAELVFVGQSASLEQVLKRARNKKRALLLQSRWSIQHAEELVAMDEAPALALKHKKQSSMRLAINRVKDGEADACVSAGNTGALMATAKFVLKTLPGIDRPAIATTMPTQYGHTCVLDLGANVDCTPQHLLQFGIMGSILTTLMDNHPKPRVGLLNVGHEPIKGNELSRLAYPLLKAAPIEFIGNVEGDDVFRGEVDVVVCDGFVGNVALKTSEGLAKMISAILKEEFSRSPLRKLAGLIALPVLKAIRRRLDGRQYNGANLLGLKGVVIKSHGSADRYAFGCALDVAYRTAKSGLLQQITADIARVNLALGIETSSSLEDNPAS